MQYALGSCRLVDIAVALVCPVVAMHSERQEAVIYGGAVHLSKEQTLLPSGPDPVFGLAVGWDGTNWDTDQVLGTVRSLSQEHGIISVTQAGSTLKPGDLLAILPVHSCLTAHLMRKYRTLDGEWIETMNS
jgi:D-serine deaminase-like pyridoxal phosphate-dependent protein